MLKKEMNFIKKIIENKRIDMLGALRKAYNNVDNDVKKNALDFLNKNKVGFQNVIESKISFTSFVIENEVHFLEIFYDIDKFVFKKDDETVSLDDYHIVAFISYILDNHDK